MHYSANPSSIMSRSNDNSIDVKPNVSKEQTSNKDGLMYSISKTSKTESKETLSRQNLDTNKIRDDDKA